MDIEIMALCDAATDSAGKLNILGAFDSIVVSSVPAVHPQCTVALRLRVWRQEEGKHHLSINIVDEDGKPVVPTLNAEVNIGFGGKESSVTANMVMNLQRLRLVQAGEYSIDVAIDGKHEKSIPLSVKLRPGANPPNANASSAN